jgi:hypothetical protein
VQRKLPAGWHRLKVPEFDDVPWTYFDAPTLVCNGIRIIGSDESESAPQWQHSEVPLNVPHVSVFDSNGVLPLVLQRDRLEGQTYPFTDQLLRAASRDFIAFLLVYAPNHSSEVDAWQSRPIVHKVLKEMLKESSFFNAHTLLRLAKGCCLMHPWHLKKGRLRRILWVESGLPLWTSDLGALHTTGIARFDFDEDELDGDRDMMQYFLDELGGAELFEPLNVEPTIAQILVRRDLCRKVRTHLHKATYDTKWLWLKTDGHREIQHAKTEKIHRRLERNHQIHRVLGEWIIDPNKISPVESPFATECENLLGDSIIPYDRKKRFAKFASAYRQLKPNIEGWKSAERWLLKPDPVRNSK